MSTDEKKAEPDESSSEDEEDSVPKETLFQNALQMSFMMPIANFGSNLLITYYNNPIQQTFTNLIYRFIDVIKYKDNITATYKGKKIVVKFTNLSPFVLKYETYDGVPDFKAKLVVHNFSTLVQSIRRYIYLIKQNGYPQNNLIRIRKHLEFLSPLINIVLSGSIQLSLLLNWDCLTLIFRLIHATIHFYNQKNRVAQQTITKFVQHDKVIEAIQTKNWTTLTNTLYIFLKKLHETFKNTDEEVKGGFFIPPSTAIPYYVNEVYRVIKEDGGLDFEMSSYSLNELLLACGLSETSQLLVLGSGVSGATCLHAASLFRMKQVVGIEAKRYSWASSLSHLWKVLARGLLQTPVFFANGNSSLLTTLSPFTHVIVQDGALLDLSLLTVVPGTSVSHVISFESLPDPVRNQFHSVQVVQVRLYSLDQLKQVYIYTTLPVTQEAPQVPQPLSALPFYINWGNAAAELELNDSMYSENTKGLEALQQGIVPYLQWIQGVVMLQQQSRPGRAQGASLRDMAFHGGAHSASHGGAHSASHGGAHSAFHGGAHSASHGGAHSAFHGGAHSASHGGAHSAFHGGAHSAFHGGAHSASSREMAFYYNGTFCEQVPFGQSFDSSLPNVFTTAESCAQSQALTPTLTRLSPLQQLSSLESAWLTANFRMVDKTPDIRTDSTVHVLVIPGWDMVWYRATLNPRSKTSYSLQHDEGVIQLYPVVYNIGTW